MRACKVFYNKKLAGVLTELASDCYEFIYDDSYLSDPANSAICFAMPKSQKCYRSEILFPFFYNLLSEGENRKFQSMYLKLDPQDDFGFLLATAQYDTAGAITVEPFDPTAMNRIPSSDITQMKEIGTIIKERRLLLQINQQTLADLAGIGINTLVAIERGTGNPTIAVLSRVLDVLGLRISVGLK